MPADHKVSVGWQIVASLIIIANFWAFYRIRKLRKYLAYVFLPALAVSIVSDYYYFANVKRFTPWGDDGLAFGDPQLDLFSQVIAPGIVLALYGFGAYLVIIWSRQHNRKFDSQTAN